MTTVDAIRRPTLRPRFDSCDIVSRAVIIVLPFILLGINNNWIFAKPVAIDRWLYSGLHLHLPQFLKTFGETYYASRLPWTVVGWILHSAFDDTVALYILHFAVFYLAVFSLYAAVRTIFVDSAAAGAAALLLGTNTYFLSAVGWDYVDGAALTCMLAGIAALASAAIRPRWRLAALMWGVAICAMVSMYILLAVLVPIQIGLFLFLNRFREKRPVFKVAALSIAGGLAAMIFLGLINWTLGGPFLYIMNQINVLASVAHNRFSYDEPLILWLRRAQYLLVPAITFAFSCVYVLSHAKSVSKNIRLTNLSANVEISLFVCCLTDIAASLLFAALQADHFYVLQMDYNANAIFPFAYLTIGGALAVMTKPSGQFRQIGFLTTVAMITLAPWVLATLDYVFPKWRYFDGWHLETAWVAAGSLLLLFVVHQSYRLMGAGLAVLFFSIVNLGAPIGLIHYPPDPTFKPKILAVFDASRAISRYNRDAEARFWFDVHDPLGQILQDVVSTYFGEYRLVNDEFPNIARVGSRQSLFAPGERIILLTSKNDDPVALANAAVADQNLLFAQVGKIEIRRSGVDFSMYVTDVKIDASKFNEIHHAFGPPVVPGSNAKLKETFPVEVSTPAHPWAYGAQFPLRKNDVLGPLWLRVLASVRDGPVGIGILNENGSAFLSRSPVFGDATVMLRVAGSERIGDLVVQSWDKGKTADVRINDIVVLKPRSDSLTTNPVSSPPDVFADADEIKDAFGPPFVPGSNVKLQDALPAEVGTPARPWAYGAQFPLRIPDLTGPLGIRVRSFVKEGPVGIGILNHGGTDFLSRILLSKLGESTVTLRVAGSERIGDLVIQSWDKGKPAEIRVDAITMIKPNSPFAEHR